MIKKNPIDYLVRKKAIGPGSFIVNAPAGSGKTSILIQRFLNLLLKVDKPTAIIAITFTNKAAMEMKQRIETALSSEIKGSDNDVLIKKINHKAQELGWHPRFYEELRILTIDKLAHQIINQTSIFENHGRNLTTEENPEDLYADSVKEIINECKYIKTIFTYLNNDYAKIIQQLVNALKKRGQWLPKIIEYKNKEMNQLKKEYENYAEKEIKNIFEQINASFTRDEKKEIRSIIEATQGINLSQNEYQYWHDFAKLIFTNNYEIRKQFDKRQWVSNDQKGEDIKLKIINFIKNNYNKINILKKLSTVNYLKKYDDFLPIIPDLILILALIYQRLNEKFTVQKKLDFEQVMINANQVLGQTNLAEILDENIDHILVDEFQDINYNQLYFLELLTQNFASNNKKTFFAVGDPMQSIYRFRKAEVEIFHQLQLNETLGEDLKLQSLRLNTNFRSNSNIINWLNDTFSILFPKSNDFHLGKITYQNVMHGNNQIQGNGIHCNLLQIDTADNREQSQAEATYVANFLKELKKERPLDSIAVLTRSRAHLNDLLSLINKKYSSLPIEAIEIFPVKENQAFIDILSLTKALFNFDDKVAWMATLRAPWVGLTNIDFAKLFQTTHKKTAWDILNDKKLVTSLSKNSQVRLTHFVKVIRRNLNFRSRLSNRFFIEAIWRQLSGPYTLINESDNPVIDLFLELVDKYSKSLISIDFVTLERQIEQEYLNTTTHLSNPIKFLTIQKAKGLEFDVVVIPNMNKQVRNENKSLFHIEKGLISIINPNEEKNLYDYHRENELERLTNEQIRLLYVAISRAKQDCYMIGSIKKTTKNIEEALESGSFQKIIWPAIQPEIIPIYPHEKIRSYGQFIPKLRRLKDVFYTDNEDVYSEINREDHTKNENNNTSTVYTFTGEIIHKYLELIVKKQLDINFILSNKLRYIERLFINKNFTKPETNLGIETFTQSLNHLLEKDIGKWLCTIHEEDYMESKYTLFHEQGMRKLLIPDRSFIDKNIRWVIDYKTVFNEKNLVSHAKMYKAQLDGYEKIFNKNYSIKKAIYFCKDGELITLD